MSTAPAATGMQYALPLASSDRKISQRLRRLTTLRLVKECSFAAPDGYPADDIPITNPRSQPM